MKTILVVYHWRKKKKSGLGNVNCGVYGDINTISNIRYMERQICKKFGFDNAIILNTIPLGNEGGDEMADCIDCLHYAEVVRCRECYYNGTEDCPMREFMKDEGLDKEPTADLNFCSYGERGE